MKEDPIQARIDIARSGFEAQIIVGLLKAAGIPACIEGGSLADEVAVAHRLMGTAGVNVMVANEQLDEALQVITAARKAAADEEDSD